MGHSVSTAGDVNGDGFSDFVVSAPEFDGGEADEGKIFLYLGAANGPGPLSFTAEGNQVGAAFGISVASAGDVATRSGTLLDVVLGGKGGEPPVGS